MNVKTVGARLSDIIVMWNKLNGNLTLKTASEEEQAEMRRRIMAVYDLYKHAKEQGIEHIPHIKTELNSIYYTLKRWEDYNAIVLSALFAKIGKMFDK